MKFLITGTHAYGPTSENSDLDIVLLHKDVIKIETFLALNKIETYQTEIQCTYDPGGFYFKIDDIEINIIIAVSKDDFNAWKTATRMMKKINPIDDRTERIDKFQKYFQDYESYVFDDI